ncbi:RsfA family transcriptional regulator [Bacillus marinisedimentorum]|uniref:RsfA family transcriptional regulator n=1 Tax=Bacillus marinisedimentorum TaxID=1821260 RepID=UPI0007E11CC6|nr:RsfA family transcriptional regulator [Bacillus marinisedimentorum]
MKVRQDAWSEEDDLLLAETVLRHIREGSTQLNAFDEVGDKLNRTSAACGFRWNAVVRNKYEQAISLAKKQRKEKKRAEQGRKQTERTPSRPAAVASVPQSAVYQVPAHENSNQQPPIETFASESADELLLPAGIEQENHYSDTAVMPETSRMQGTADMTLDGVIAYLQSFRDFSLQDERMAIENERLRKENEEITESNHKLEQRVKQLEKQHQQMQEDYQALLQIMDRARRMVLMEDDDKPSTAFRMDRNGNLEKIADSQ